MTGLRDRVIRAVYDDGYMPASKAAAIADSVLRELDLGIPCAADGCKVRRLARGKAGEE